MYKAEGNIKLLDERVKTLGGLEYAKDFYQSPLDCIVYNGGKAANGVSK